MAAKMWGRYKDTRGFDVARNRDRISLYIRGASMPDPPNLKKLADALGMSVHELLEAEGDAPDAPVTTNGDYSPLTAMDPIPNEGQFVYLRLHRKLRAQDAARLIGMAESMAEQAEELPRIPLNGGGGK